MNSANTMLSWLAGLLLAVVVLVWSFCLPLLHANDHSVWAVWLNAEDGPFETLGALACLMGAITFGLGYIWQLQTATWFGQTYRASPIWLLAAIALLLMFFEEISWGQRTLGFDTPYWARDANIQQEFNLHNLRWFHPRLESNWLKFGWLLANFVYLGVLPILAALRPLWREAWQRWGLPLVSGPVAAGAWTALACYVINLNWSLSSGDRFAGHDAGETIECLFELLLAIVALQSFWRYATPLQTRRLVSVCGVLIGIPALVMGWSILQSARDPVASFDAVALSRLGELARRRGDPVAAREFLDRAQAQAPDRPELSLQLGRLAYEQHDYSSAAQHFEQAIALDPNLTPALTNLAIVRLAERRYGDAIQVLSRVVQLEPDSPQAHCDLGNALLMSGDRERARVEYETALQLDPSHAQARQNLASLDQGSDPTAPSPERASDSPAPQ
jgi:tetratricopeptide (TPR) repeat protein